MMMMMCRILWMSSVDVDGPGAAARGAVAPIGAMAVAAAIAAYEASASCRRRFMRSRIPRLDCAFVNGGGRRASTSAPRGDTDEEVVVAQVVGRVPELRPDRARDAARRGL